MSSSKKKSHNLAEGVQQAAGNISLRWNVIVLLVSLFAYLMAKEIWSRGTPANVRGMRVIITGASQGIGASLVKEYAKLGASQIVMVARSKDKMTALAEDIGGLYPQTKLHVVAADLSSEQNCNDAIVDSVAKLGGGLDVLVLNHITTSHFGLFLERQHEEGLGFVENMFRVNTQSYIFLAAAALPVLKASEHGYVGVVSSLAAHVGTPKTAVYSATKHALHGFFDALRLELRRDEKFKNISVTLCAIGATDTEGASAIKKQMSPSIQWDSPEDAASAIVKGIANKKREIYHPYILVYPAIIVGKFFPWLLDNVLLSTIET